MAFFHDNPAAVTQTYQRKTRAFALVLTLPLGCVWGHAGAAPRFAPSLVAAAETSPATPQTANPSHADKPPGKGTTAVFATGMTLFGLGTLGTIGFGSAGLVTNRQLNRGYDRGFDRETHDRLVHRGQRMNNLTVASLSVGLVGLVVAAIAYGVDYTRCGRLAKRARKCR